MFRREAQGFTGNPSCPTTRGCRLDGCLITRRAIGEKGLEKKVCPEGIVCEPNPNAVIRLVETPALEARPRSPRA